MNRPILKDALGWGLILWLIGYGLGIMLFVVVPLSLIGWIIAPVGVAITLWVLFKKVSGNTLGYYYICRNGLGFYRRRVRLFFPLQSI